MRAQTQAADQALIEMTGVAVIIDGRPVLSDINWALYPGQNWVIHGGNGAGKSTFLRLVRGDLWPAPGSGQRSYLINGGRQASPIGFKERTRLVSLDLLDQYRRLGWNLTCLEAVCTGFFDWPLLYDRPAQEQLTQAQRIMDRFGLAGQAERRINELSQGQAKKVLIARALAGRPDLLILDEVCEGLDRQSRAELLALIQQAAESGTQILYATHRTEELVPAFSHTLSLEGGRITGQGAIAPLPGRRPERRVSERAPRLHLVARPAAAPGRPSLFELKDAAVVINDRRILSDLNWTIHQGENWALVGANGSGKSTLLKLLAGDLRPVWGGSIVRFSDPDLTNLMAIRRRLSLVSPHFQADHQARQTALETVLSGFSGSIGFHRRPTGPEDEAARSWLERLGLDGLAEEDIRTLSYGQLRRVLIARAMVGRPEVLLLDEPLGGLDGPARDEVSALIEDLARDGTAVIYATHYQEELIPSITHLAVMDGGRLAYQGPRADFSPGEAD